jgi:hypothetical protein
VWRGGATGIRFGTVVDCEKRSWEGGREMWDMTSELGRGDLGERGRKVEWEMGGCCDQDRGR